MVVLDDRLLFGNRQRFSRLGEEAARFADGICDDVFERLIVIGWLHCNDIPYGRGFDLEASLDIPAVVVEIVVDPIGYVRTIIALAFCLHRGVDPLWECVVRAEFFFPFAEDQDIRNGVGACAPEHFVVEAYALDELGLAGEILAGCVVCLVHGALGGDGHDDAAGAHFINHAVDEVVMNHVVVAAVAFRIVDREVAERDVAYGKVEGVVGKCRILERRFRYVCVRIGVLRDLGREFIELDAEEMAVFLQVVRHAAQKASAAGGRVQPLYKIDTITYP